MRILFLSSKKYLIEFGFCQKNHRTAILLEQRKLPNKFNAFQIQSLNYVKDAIQIKKAQVNNYADILSSKDEPSVANIICILQKCRKKKDLKHAKCIYVQVYGLEVHRALGNYVVPVLVACGSVFDAQHTFGGLLYRDEHSWTSLVLGYLECGQTKDALSVYQKMQEDSIHPSGYTLVALLRACARVNDMEMGKRIHAQIRKNGLEIDQYVGSTLIGMYAKCGSLAEAYEVFDKLQNRNVVSWTILINGYVEQGYEQEALDCFKQMEFEGVQPNAFTFVCSLKACTKLAAIDKGREIQIKVSQRGLESDIFVGNALIDMYSKFGSPQEAKVVFEKLPVQSVVSWTALISGYVENGLAVEALECFERMQVDGVSPNAVTYVSVLKACSRIGEIDRGREIHLEIAKKGFEKDIFIGSALISMYAKCGQPSEARIIFDNLPVRSVVTWTALIAGYAANGHCQEAVTCFDQMAQDGIIPTAVTYTCSLKACACMGNIEKGRDIHIEITNNGLEGDVLIGNSLIDMYAKCGSLTEAQQVFDKLPVQDIVSWNAVISGNAENGSGVKALECFDELQLKGMSPNAVTFICALKACSSLRAIDKGKEIHIQLTRMGLEKDLSVGNILLDMYGKCGLVNEAQEIFEKLPFRDTVSWNTIIAGYAENGLGEKALDSFYVMLREGETPDAITYSCSLKACGNLREIDRGREIHTEVIQKGFETDLSVGNTLVDMYAKCESLAEVFIVFDRMPVRDVASWTVVIAAYDELGCGQEVLKCFEQMRLDKVSHNAVTLMCSLKACGSMGAIDKGREIHTLIVNGWLKGDLSLVNALVEFYGKCGLLAEARKIFDNLSVRDVVSWTIMIVAYGMNHEAAMALRCFNEMQEQGIKPDAITFISLLNTCSRGGLLVEGQKCFKLMREVYDIEPSMDHYVCMVDLFARSGHLYEAEDFLQNISYPSEEALVALLSACKSYGEEEVGLRSFQRIACMNPGNANLYVLTADIYESNGTWEATKS